MTAVRAIVLGLLAVSFATGCGGDGGSGSASPTTKWAGDLCSSITTWTDSISSAAASLREGNLTQAKVRSAVEDVKGATNDFVANVKGLGPPDTKAGQQAKESLDALASDLQTNTATIDKALENASGPSETLQALPVITGALSTMGSRLSSTFTELGRLDAGGELENAFKKAELMQEADLGLELTATLTGDVAIQTAVPRKRSQPTASIVFLDRVR